MGQVACNDNGQSIPVVGQRMGQALFKPRTRIKADDLLIGRCDMNVRKEDDLVHGRFSASRFAGRLLRLRPLYVELSVKFDQQVFGINLTACGDVNGFDHGVTFGM